MFRKQMRQTPNFRKNALGRPQIGHRLYVRTLNLGVRIAFNLSDFFAKSSSLRSCFSAPPRRAAGPALGPYQFRNGIPSSRNSSLPSSSVRALVTMLTFNPLILSILS